MRRILLVLVAVFLGSARISSATGLLIPVEPDIPPLALLNHRVDVSIQDQVAVTTVVQTFRNHTDRQLEATYVFPVPEGASVRDLAMKVDGQRMKGELFKSDKAKELYTEIVRQTRNPALLDYVGLDMLRLKIFPIPPQGEQTVEVRFTTIIQKQHNLVEYVYPLKTDRAAPSTLAEFRLLVDLQSQRPIGGIYSPSHAVTVNQENDQHAIVQFEQNGARLDRDFRLFYTSSGDDIGVTALQHRPVSDEDGYVLLLVSPRAELSKKQKVPRDIVFVVDTSGSMIQDKKMTQAKAALKQCLKGLTEDDRFGLVSFATTVEHYRAELMPVNDEQLKRAQGWVSDLYAGGGTAIHRALTSALEMRSDHPGRMFTVVFLTDGQPTIGERDTDKILAAMAESSSANTRIFSFGVGDDLNAVFLDKLAEQTRAISSYVRPGQDLEAKVSGFFGKIHHPVLANLRLRSDSGVRLTEVYPPQLPDLFHGDQLVVLARYQGAGNTDVYLDGNVGPHEKQFAYNLDFRATGDEKPFVEELWARRKVGYLLDQIRVGGEEKELVDEVVRLAKHYGITTPYTSYLIVPDAPLVAAAGVRDRERFALGVPPALAESNGQQRKVESFAREVQRRSGDLAANRGKYQDEVLEESVKRFAELAQGTSPAPADKLVRQRLKESKDLKSTLDRAYWNFNRGELRANQVSQLGVSLAVCTANLKCQSQVPPTAVCRVAKRNCMEIGGVWIDEAFSYKTPTVAIKAQSDAYFRILERQPQMREVFKLGNHVVWIAPNGSGLVIDTIDGQERLSDQDIDALFASN